MAADAQAPAHRSGLAAALGVPVLLGAAAGGLGGWLWWRWWSPAPSGRIYDTSAGRVWYPDPFDPGVTRDFSGTAEYVVIGLGLGLLLGVVAGVISRRQAVSGLVSTLLGSAIAAGVAAVVGLSQSPADPQEKAADLPVGTTLPGHLSLAQARIPLPGDGHLPLTTPWLAWPVGALLGFLAVMLTIGWLEQRAAYRAGAPGAQGIQGTQGSGIPAAPRVD